MSHISHKIASFLLAIVVLFSTMSFTIDKHYCGTMLVDVAINAKAKTCGMEVTLSPEQVRAGKKSCCQNEHIVILGQDELNKNVDTALELPVFEAIPTPHSLPWHDVQDSILHINMGNHDPPDIVSNFQQLYQTYLI